MEKSVSDPVDPCHSVFLVFKLLGMGTLLPWNFFISVSGYWMYKFRDVSEETLIPLATNTTDYEDSEEETMDGLTSLQTKWSSYLSIASMLPNVLMLLLNAAAGHHFRLLPRIFVSLVIVVMLFVLTCVMTKVNTDHWQHLFMDLTLVSVVAISVAVAIVQGGLSALAAKFPPRYMGAVVQGQALGGIFAAATNVVFLALGTSHVDAAFYCFLVAIFFICASLAAFTALTRSEFFDHYYSHRHLQPEDQKMMRGDDDEPEVKFRPSNDHKKINVLRITMQIQVWIASVFITFMVTLAVFPALTVLVISEDYGQGYLWNDRFFTPVGCFLLFNIGDYVGRIVAGITHWPGPTRSGSLILLIISVLRIGLVPLFLLCNASPNNRVVTPVLFESDLVFLGLMAILSLSGGYIGSIAMMFGPKSIEGDAHAQSTAASLMVAFLVLGLAFGSLMSFGVLMLL